MVDGILLSKCDMRTMNNENLSFSAKSLLKKCIHIYSLLKIYCMGSTMFQF